MSIIGRTNPSRTEPKPVDELIDLLHEREGYFARKGFSYIQIFSSLVDTDFPPRAIASALFLADFIDLRQYRVVLQVCEEMEKAKP